MAKWSYGTASIFAICCHPDGDARGNSAHALAVVPLTAYPYPREEAVRKRRTVGFVVLLVSMLALSQPARASSPAEDAAVAASQSWLALVDAGEYSESWDEAAGYFKTAVTKEQWQRSLTAFRRPLGDVLSRRLKLRKYTTTLPGAPDGEYVVIQYETSFENKKSAIETVTPMLDTEGKWRVSGYYIK